MVVVGNSGSLNSDACSLRRSANGCARSSIAGVTDATRCSTCRVVDARASCARAACTASLTPVHRRWRSRPEVDATPERRDLLELLRRERQPCHGSPDPWPVPRSRRRAVQQRAGGADRHAVLRPALRGAFHRRQRAAEIVAPDVAAVDHARATAACGWPAPLRCTRSSCSGARTRSTCTELTGRLKASGGCRPDRRSRWRALMATDGAACASDR